MTDSTTNAPQGEPLTVEERIANLEETADRLEEMVHEAQTKLSGYGDLCKGIVAMIDGFEDFHANGGGE